MSIETKLNALNFLKNKFEENEAEFKQIKQTAEIQNPWFTQEFISLAIQNICDAFLDINKLTNFANKYNFSNTEKKTIGLVMAGNIPLVGFHDFLCLYLSPFQIKVKLSNKDSVLMQYVFANLIAADPNLASRLEVAEMVKHCDAYIATGSNNSARHFEYYFAKYPHIIRRNRTSVAILDGHENEDDLINLGKDVFTFFGLGCRNVTQLYVPENYNFEKLIQSFKAFAYLHDHHKYKNNYDYYLAIAILNNQFYMSNGSLLLLENNNIFSPLAVLNYSFYADQPTLIKTLEKNEDVQCIVSAKHIPFGSAQQPKLSDFADGVDTMQWLCSL